MFIFLDVYTLGGRKHLTRQIYDLREGKIIWSLQELLDGLFVERKVVLYCIPNAGEVDREIFRDDLFADTHHFRPRKFRMHALKFDGDATGRIPNDLDLADHGVLHHGAGKEFTFRHASCVAFNLFYGVVNVM